MKRANIYFLIAATLASLAPATAHAGGSEAEQADQARLAKEKSAPAKTVTIAAPGADQDLEHLMSLKLNGWRIIGKDTNWFSQIALETGKRRQDMIVACGPSIVRGSIRKAVHTVFSALPLVSRADHYIMDKLYPDEMGTVSRYWNHGPAEYSRATWKGGAVTLAQGVVERRDMRRQMSVATITGDAAFINEITRPRCMNSYLAWQRARAMLAWKEGTRADKNAQAARDPAVADQLRAKAEEKRAYSRRIYAGAQEYARDPAGRLADSLHGVRATITAEDVIPLQE